MVFENCSNFNAIIHAVSVRRQALRSVKTNQVVSFTLFHSFTASNDRAFAARVTSTKRNRNNEYTVTLNTRALFIKLTTVIAVRSYIQRFYELPLNS